MSTNESTPTVGRWQYWLCGCTPAHNQNVMLPSEPECRECGTVRPPLPETPAPRVEPIAGVSEAMIDAAMRADGFGYAAISDTLPDLVAQTREWYRRILSAALRAVPVEGGEPIAWVDDAGWTCRCGTLRMTAFPRCPRCGDWWKGPPEAERANPRAEPRETGEHREGPNTGAATHGTNSDGLITQPLAEFPPATCSRCLDTGCDGEGNECPWCVKSDEDRESASFCRCTPRMEVCESCAFDRGYRSGRAGRKIVTTEIEALRKEARERSAAESWVCDALDRIALMLPSGEMHPAPDAEVRDA